MFNSFTGEITFKGDERVCVLTAGVEWDLTASRKSLDMLPAVGEVARVYVHLVHREDLMRLYGFADPQERALFLDLQRVPGVGPRKAIEMLSRVDREQLVQALDHDDVDTLSALPGVGKTTAQKMILALKGKLTPVGEGKGRPAEEDIATALVGMGFDRKTARAAASAALTALAGRGLAGEELERELLRQALAIASGGSPAGGRKEDAP
ncbi:MAG TPA: Holliday junction branch migration protein RuvA [Spirochaetia bacterium]|nr:Holliday junction branch migration protein RuvA [Spirochaetia bacterium]